MLIGKDIEMKIALRAANEPYLRPFTVATQGPAGLVGSATATEVTGSGIKNLLAAGAAVGSVYKGGAFLIQRANAVTPDQVAHALQQYNFVTDSGMAQEQGKSLVAQLQSKGGNSILFGAVAGVATYAFVEAVKPKWPQSVKLGIAAAVAVAVGSMLFWGLKDKPHEPGVGRSVAGQAAPASSER